MKAGQWIYRLVLLAAGWVFFAWNEPAALFWLMGVTAYGYGCGRILGRESSVNEEAGHRRKPRVLLAVMILIPVVMLTVFKYGGLITGESFLIPLGLSYYTLMVIGYLIDVYRGDVRAEINPVIFALYTGFFPQATAGPVGRAKDLLEQYRQRIVVSVEDIKTGLLMIVLGVFEKWVLADNLHQVVDGLVAGEADGLPIIIAMLFFSLVIYYDFAGYSLIAIGLGRLMGIRLQENFRSPYLAASVREFWHRWHISLSTWFRDYLYIPLGGSRVSPLRRDVNTLIVFTVSGAWHGQLAGFWLWGFLHGMYLVVENRLRGIGSGKDKPTGNRRCPAVKRMAGRIVTFLLVSIAWVPFYAGKLWKTRDLFGRMFSGDMDDFWRAFSDGFGLRYEIWIILGIGVVFYLIISILQEKNGYLFIEKTANHGWVIFILGIVFYTVLLLAGVYGSEYDATTFIYGGF